MSLEKLANMAPFLTIAAKEVKVNWSRVIEAFVIAAVTAIGVSYTSTQVTSAKQDLMEQQITRISHRVDQIYENSYQAEGAPWIPPALKTR